MMPSQSSWTVSGRQSTRTLLSSLKWSPRSSKENDALQHHDASRHTISLGPLKSRKNKITRPKAPFDAGKTRPLITRATIVEMEKSGVKSDPYTAGENARKDMINAFKQCTNVKLGSTWTDGADTCLTETRVSAPESAYQSYNCLDALQLDTLGLLAPPHYPQDWIASSHPSPTSSPAPLPRDRAVEDAPLLRPTSLPSSISLVNAPAGDPSIEGENATTTEKEKRSSSLSLAPVRLSLNDVDAINSALDTLVARLSSELSVSDTSATATTHVVPAPSDPPHQSMVVRPKTSKKRYGHYGEHWTMEDLNSYTDDEPRDAENNDVTTTFEAPSPRAVDTQVIKKRLRRMYNYRNTKERPWCNRVARAELHLLQQDDEDFDSTEDVTSLFTQTVTTPVTPVRTSLWHVQVTRGVYDKENKEVTSGPVKRARHTSSALNTKTPTASNKVYHASEAPATLSRVGNLLRGTMKSVGTMRQRGRALRTLFSASSD